MNSYIINKKKSLFAIALFLTVILFTGCFFIANARPAEAASQNRFVVRNGVYYYYKGKTPAKGWVTRSKGRKYYFDPVTGAARPGIVKINGHYYYFAQNGKMLIGWRVHNGKYYYFGKNGRMYRNKLATINGNRYYFTSKGHRAGGIVKINRKLYVFNPRTGIQLRNCWYQEKNGSRYFVSRKYHLTKGFCKIGSHYYYFNPSDGKMLTGWIVVSGNSYYMNKTGERQTGWIKLSGKRYYLNPATGIMARNKWIDKKHYVGNDGAWISGYTGKCFSWPLAASSNTITSKFGPRTAPGPAASTYHKGIDIAARHGQKIYAAAAGTIELIQPASQGGGAGNYTRIRHANGMITEYMHQSKFANIKIGQKVKRGQLIGYVGNTGASYGAHLHFGVIVNNVNKDPLNYVDVPK